MKIESKNWRHRAATKADFIAATRDVLADALEPRGITAIHINDADGATQKPIKEEATFWVHLYSRARANVGVLERPRRVFGKPVRTCGDKDRVLFEPSGDGLVVVDPASGYAVAEIVGDNLYVFFSCNTSCCHEASTPAYRRVLEEAVPLLGGAIPPLSEIAAGKAVPEVRPSPILARELVESRRLIEGDVALAQRLHAQLVSAEAGADADAVLETLRRVPEVRHVDVTRDGTLRLLTHVMCAKNLRTDKLHEFGEFDIRLRFGREEISRAVTFQNLTRRVDYREDEYSPGEYGHPHVERPGNKYCMGEGEAILPLLRAYEIEAAALFALKAIQSVNTSDTGNYLRVLRLFPVVESPPKYPAEPAEIGDSTRLAFRRLYEGARSSDEERTRQRLRETLASIDGHQASIARGAFYAKLKQLGHDAGAAIGEALEAARDAALGAEVLLQGDVLTVRLRNLSVRDLSTDRDTRVKDVVLTCDVRRGSVRLSSGSPLPQVDELWEGRLPAGQLTATLPELLGGLEFAAAASMTLAFLGEFESGEEPEEALPVAA